MVGGRLDTLRGGQASLSHPISSKGTGSTPTRQQVTKRESVSTPDLSHVLTSDALLTYKPCHHLLGSQQMGKQKGDGW